MFTQQEITYFRQELNLTPDTLMVNNGSWGAMCRAALNAYVGVLYKDSLINRVTAPGSIMADMADYMDQDRREVAYFLNCSPEEVAISESTTAGLNLCLYGIDLQPGDEILSCPLENGAGFGVLKTVAARRNVKIKYIDIGRLGEKDAVKAVEEAITPKTRVAMLSHVIYVNGVALDIKGISKVCREHGVLTVIDGVQAAGTMKIDVQDLGCDAYCIARHKFLNGPDGAGAVYIRRNSFDSFQPTFAGVFNDNFHGFKEYSPNYNGSRFDVTTRAYPAQASAAAAMKWHREHVGFDRLYQQIHTLRSYLFDKLITIDGLTMQSLKASTESALINFNLDNIAPPQLSKYLGEKKIGNRVVDHWYGPDFLDADMLTGVRVSISFWNTFEDMDKAFEIIKEASKL